MRTRELIAGCVVILLLNGAPNALAGSDHPPNGKDHVAPTAPSNLSVPAATTDAITLSWTSSTDRYGVAGYNLYSDAAKVGTTTTTTAVFGGYRCGTSHQLGVQAFDTAGNVSEITTITASTTPCLSTVASTPVVVDVTAPTVPAGLAVVGVSGSSVSLSWAASSDNVGVAGYNVFVNGTLRGATSSTAYSVSSLACGTSYTFAVQAFDQAGNLSPLTSVVATTAACATSGVVCTKTLASGGALSSFVNSLKPGDVGCLHGGSYSDGTIVTWTASGSATAPVIVTSYPGETAEIVGTTFYLDGNYQIMRNLTVRDVTTVDGDGIAVSGSGNRVEHNLVRNIYRQGILLHTDATNAVIAGNDVRDVGQPGSNQDHGIYVQGNGHLIVNNVFADMRGGYGIHVYPSSSNVTVAQNTVVNSQTRSGILIDTSGGNIAVINNIVVGNSDYGILNEQCSLGGCIVDHNLAWNNRLGAISGPASNTIQADPQFIDSNYHLASTSPAINSARPDYSYSPDHDGTPRPQGNAPDLGAYEQ